MNRALKAILSILDPRAYLHLFRLVHYYNYSHVGPRREVKMGAGTQMAPNVSLRNGGRIRLGRGCHVGEHSCLWAGDSEGAIEIGDNVSIAPRVFVTASDYRFIKGVPFRSQPKRESLVRIGSDVWLGTGVIVTAGVTIGDGCIVGAGAVVTRNLPPNCIAAGVPARPIAERKEN